MTIQEFLQSRREGDYISLEAEREGAGKLGCTLAEFEREALLMGVIPARYRRNNNALSAEDQLRLLSSTAAVVGCGGLGGYCIEELTRLGVGRLIVIDPDRFEEHNLNRQILSSPAVLGMIKAQVAARRIAEINPAAAAVPSMEALTLQNGEDLLKGADVVLDGLDSIKSRLELAEICHRMGVPLVHGALGGWYGQVTVEKDGKGLIGNIYKGSCNRKGVEAVQGTLSFTAAAVASMEVAEACKILLGKGNSLVNRLLSLDLLDSRFTLLDFPASRK